MLVLNTFNNSNSVSLTADIAGVIGTGLQAWKKHHRAIRQPLSKLSGKTLLQRFDYRQVIKSGQRCIEVATKPSAGPDQIGFNG